MKLRRNQAGVALVITLIMLTVITLIAVAFLALSQRERSSVSSTIVASETEQALNAGLDRAKGQIVANMLAFFANPTNRVATNGALQWIPALNLGPDLLVSVAGSGITNYPQNQSDYPAFTNLLIDPIPPVFVSRTGALQSVHYLDLNRNRVFDETGNVLIRDNNGNPITGLTNYVIGDPQWIGVLSRPNEPHSSSNRFGGRFAYIILPVGRSSSIDSIHNSAGGGLFTRNQGHGSWELNLAALLTDLNTNFWRNYDYGTVAGEGFLDATNILAYRSLATNLPTAEQTFGISTDFFAGDGIDQYGNGNDSSGFWSGEPWPGAPNRQHFFSIHDFFNGKTPTFQNRLFNAGLSLNSYDRHTFYRMLAQLGTDTAPERTQYRVLTNSAGRIVDQGPINLNYANTNGTDATRFEPWTAEGFFHTVADRLLRDHGFAIDANTPLSVMNLPVYPTNFYTPAVHRILQMTLNIFDATTADGAAYPYYPTALRPFFAKNGNEIVISGYARVPTNHQATITNARKWRDLSLASDRSDLVQDDFVYGVPILIGAKKGYPSFNEFVFQSEVQFERRVQVWKDANAPLPTHAAQMFMVGSSNSFGLEAWNSYTSAFPRALEMYTGVEVTSELSNDEGFRGTNLFASTTSNNISSGVWQGRQFRDVRGVVTNLWTNSIVVPFLGYQNRQFFTGNRWDTSFATPQWVLSNSVHVRFFLFDDGYLVGATAPSPAVLSTNVTAAVASAGLYGQLWSTNRVAGRGSLASVTMTEGVRSQLEISQGTVTLGANIDWNDFGNFRNTVQEKQGFFSFLNVRSNSPVALTNQAPFTPQVKIYRRVEWKANDPLVHQMDQDLRRDRESKPQFTGASPRNARNRLVFDLGKRNAEYQPWGGEGTLFAPGREYLWDPSIIDPSVQNSDAWDFPTNKFPSIGALGRVHRGTPWQTIYMKSLPASMQQWTNIHASLRSHPTNDWRLADIFTVAQHPNASRGRMSVNQTNLAGWSAVLSGVQIPYIDGTGQAQTNVIEPALKDSTLDRLVEAINARRETLPGQVFSSLSEFLAVPELTTNSPYVTPPTGPAIAQPDQNPLKDEHYEALPAKILSLVKPGEARFVVYVFGQSLKPAPQSVISGGPFRGLCVNYEVTGEMAAKAVMRVDLVPAPPPNPVPSGGYLPVRPQVVIESFNLLPPD